MLVGSSNSRVSDAGSTPAASTKSTTNLLIKGILSVDGFCFTPKSSNTGVFWPWHFALYKSLGIWKHVFRKALDPNFSDLVERLPHSSTSGGRCFYRLAGSLQKDLPR